MTDFSDPHDLRDISNDAVSDSRDPVGKRRAKVLSDPFLHRAQRVHFLLYDVLPIFGVVAAALLLFVQPLRWSDVISFVLMWFVTGAGISVGYHRLFTHRSFKAVRPVRLFLAIGGAMAGQGGILSWAAMHRRHHEYGDKEGDMHSPNLHGDDWRGKLKGFVHAHFTWMIKHPYPNVVHYAPDLLRDRSLVWVSKHYQHWVILGLAIPAVLGGVISQSWLGALSGFLWGGLVRMFVVGQLIWSLNSVCHLIGSRLFQTADQSRNVWWLTPFFFGEAWHHNHHAFPGSAWFGLSWYRLDPGYLIIRTLALLGLATEVKVPSKAQLDKKRLSNRQQVAAE